MDLLNLLQNKDSREVYIQSIFKIKDFIRPLLNEIKVLFPDFTKHGIEHSESVERILNKIIPNKIKEVFNIYELYFLLSAAYLHDVGMSPLKNFISKPLDTTRKQDLPEHIRKTHHLRSERFITENYTKLSIEDLHAARIIGIICRLHRNEPLEDKIAYKNKTINIPFLSMWLRIADELDLTFERIPTYDLEKFPIDETSRIHWDSHFTISGWNFDDIDPSLIVANAKCKSGEIHRQLKHMESKINGQFQLLRENIGNYRKFITLLPREIKIKITPNGYTPLDLKFTLESYEIINHLVEDVYKTPKYAIREIMKNAIDSCRLRKLKEKEIYCPEIRVSIDEGKKLLEIEDNGLGMSEKIIKNYLTIIGESYYVDGELEENFDSLSQLGIGILSYFRLTDRVIIETKCKTEKAFKIEINDVFDYMIISESEKTNPGTKVSLKLSEDAIYELIHNGNQKEDKFLMSNKQKRGKKIGFMQSKILFNMLLCRYMRHIDIPIYLIVNNDDPLKIEVDGYDLIPKQMNLFHKIIEVNEEEMEGKVAVFLGGENWPYVRSSEIISYSGVLVSDSNQYLFRYTNFTSILVKYDLNFHNRSIDLSLSRDDILSNSKIRHKMELIQNIVLEKLPDYLKEYRILFKRSEDTYIQKIRNTFIKGFNKFNDPRIQELLKKYFYFEIISKDQINFLNYDNIQSNREKVRIIQFQPSINNKTHTRWVSAIEIDVMRKITAFKMSLENSNDFNILKEFQEIDYNIDLSKYFDLSIIFDFMHLSNINEFFEGFKIIIFKI